MTFVVLPYRDSGCHCMSGLSDECLQFDRSNRLILFWVLFQKRRKLDCQEEQSSFFMGGVNTVDECLNVSAAVDFWSFTSVCFFTHSIPPDNVSILIIAW